jgi:hypothetical protein
LRGTLQINKQMPPSHHHVALIRVIKHRYPIRLTRSQHAALDTPTRHTIRNNNPRRQRDAPIDKRFDLEPNRTNSNIINLKSRNR